MSIIRERLRQTLASAFVLALFSVPALFVLTSCHDTRSMAPKDRRATVQGPRQDANSLSGELRLLRSSGVATGQRENPAQYSSLSDPYLEKDAAPYLNEERSYAEDEATLINASAAVRGLNGKLTTAHAGQTLLADNGFKVRGPSSSATVATTASKYFTDDAPGTSKRLKTSKGLTSNLLTTAYSLTGRPYLDGGMTPENGFDDLGFVSYVYSKAGAAIFPKNAKGALSAGRPVTKEALRPGDVLVYRNPRNESQYLLGIYTGNGNFLLSSSRLKLVSETAAFGIDYGPYFVGGRRYFEDDAAAPLSDSMKMAATNGAVKQALANLGPIPKTTYKATTKRKSSKKGSKSRSGRSRSSRRK
ncbi:MAG: C40 family peptidase [Deltaproteobacteria bacterium]|jgi:cell wall-associated NlpC family hydrolase|nr:C40 family peptidase [Deltaproteobacteria bacterium]